jgi:fructose-1,6-bisphosphatase
VLSTLIYYPEQKLALLKSGIPNLEEWYKITCTGSSSSPASWRSK